MRSYAAFRHRDRNHSTIADELRRRGVIVEETFQPLDCLIWDRSTHVWGWMEVKMPGSQAKWTRSQVAFISNTPMPVVIATEAAQALAFLKTGVGVSQKQKDALAGFLMRSREKFFTPKEIAEVLG